MRRHTILYDDQTQEEVDLQKIQYKFIYRLNPPNLLLSKKPSKPLVSDCTTVTWPPLMAAAAVRLVKSWGVEEPILDERPAPSTEAGSASADAAPAAAAPAAADSDDSDDDDDVPLSTHAASLGMGMHQGMQQLPPKERCKEQLKGQGAEATAPMSAAELLRRPLQQAVFNLLGAAPHTWQDTYSAMPLEQKLALLSTIVEAVAETTSAAQAAESRALRRHEAQNRLEAEERDAKKQLRKDKDEARTAIRAGLETRAREQLEATGGSEPIEVSEAQVNFEMQKRSEAEACGAAVHVLSLDALVRTESEAAVALEIQAAGVDENGLELSAEAVEALTQRKNDMRRRVDRLHGEREAVTKLLREVAQSSDEKTLTGALGRAREVCLEGHHEHDGIGPGGRWLTMEVRDCHVALFEVRKLKSEQLLHGRRQLALSELSVRGEVLGRDRYGCRYWALEDDPANPAEATNRDERGVPMPVVWVQPRTKELQGGIPTPHAGAVEGRRFGEWECFRGAEALSALSASLDHRGLWEKALQERLKQHVAAFAMRAIAVAHEETPL